ncbi:CD59 glycoprotein-like [Erythrolamprus reginae]|uniref:CD59 glycoprotein-like n=1 Tax=Erythrolamprus reginae TaxID=121349 RepID=UPI00396C2E6D
MKSLLVTAAIITFALALFFHSGNALVCYDCPSTNCDNQVTCTGEQDICLIVNYGAQNKSSCWKLSDCNVDFIADHFKLKNFRYRCCRSDLCNNATTVETENNNAPTIETENNYVPNVVTSKIVLSGSFLLTVVHMLKSLV